MKLLSLCSKQLPLIAFAVATATTHAVAKEAIKVCGPDGSVPAIREVASSHGLVKNVTVIRFKSTGGADVMLTRKGI